MAEIPTPELILTNGKLTTLDKCLPEAAAVAISDGRFTAVGAESVVLPTALQLHSSSP